MPGFTWFYWVLLGFTWFYWVLPSFTGFYWVLPGFTASVFPNNAYFFLEMILELVLLGRSTSRAAPRHRRRAARLPVADRRGLPSFYRVYRRCRVTDVLSIVDR